MKVMLDTNVCSYLIRQKDQAMVAWALRHKPGELGISVITLCELEYGIANSSNPGKNASALMQFLAPVEIADFNASVATVYGSIRFGLKHSPIGPMDTLIAAHAISLDVELATLNIKEFSRVGGLRLAKLK